MSTYAVFGMTRPRANEIAKRAVDKKLEKDGDKVPELKWLELVSKKCDEVMRSDRVVMLSERFDAPQFAREFKALAERLEHRDLIIKAHCPVHGEYTKTGKRKMHWVVTQ